MPRIRDIARIVAESEGAKRLFSAEKKVFFDTSYLVACDQRQLWAMMVNFYLEREGLGFIIIDEIRRELNDLYKNEKKDDDGRRKVITDYDAKFEINPPFSIVVDISDDCIRRAMQAWDKYGRKDREIKTMTAEGKTVTVVLKDKRTEPADADLKIIAAALHHALYNGESIVVSADSDITKTIEGLIEEYAAAGACLKLDYFSPNKLPDADDFYKEPLLVVTPKAIEELTSASEAENRNFLAVATDITLSGHTFDIGLGVHTKRIYTDKLPNIQGISYTPVYYVGHLEMRDIENVAKKIAENGRIVTRVRRGKNYAAYDYKRTQTGWNFTPVRVCRTDSKVRPFWTPELDRLEALVA